MAWPELFERAMGGVGPEEDYRVESLWSSVPLSAKNGVALDDVSGASTLNA